MKIAGEISGPGPARDCHNLLTENSCPVLRGRFPIPACGLSPKINTAICGWAPVVAASFTGTGVIHSVLNAAGAGQPPGDGAPYGPGGSALDRRRRRRVIASSGWQDPKFRLHRWPAG